MKAKALLPIIALVMTSVIFSCSKGDDNSVKPFDHVAQEKKDRDSLEQYLKTHYLDENNEIKKIDAKQKPLISQVKDTTITITKNYADDSVDTDVTISYKLYYLVYEQGNGVYPTDLDSINYSYKGFLLDGTVFGRDDYGTWDLLNDVNYSKVSYITVGKAQGLKFFKTGDGYIDNQDGTITYTNMGKGYIFMPSGLAYGNALVGNIPSSSPLVYHISSNLSRHADLDGDGILSIYEDVNGNKDFFDDDTDSDKYYNFFDPDDDGDGIATKDENADPNADGNPDDAKDTDGDGIPDYLDADN